MAVSSNQTSWEIRNISGHTDWIMVAFSVDGIANEFFTDCYEFIYHRKSHELTLPRISPEYGYDCLSCRILNYYSSVVWDDFRMNLFNI